MFLRSTLRRMALNRDGTPVDRPVNAFNEKIELLRIGALAGHVSTLVLQPDFVILRRGGAGKGATV